MKQIGKIVATVLLVGLPAIAQAPAETGWLALFNGKDLTGWRKNGDEKWIAEKGTILSESTANKYGYLTTEKTYRDFDLRLKFKGEAAGNSGLFFHARITGIDPEHGPDIEGMQVEVDRDGHIPGEAQEALGGAEPIAALEARAGGIELERARVHEAPAPDVAS